MEELVKRYHRRLIRKVYRHLANLDDAEEVVQEFWKDFVRSVDRHYDPQRGKLARWIFGLLHHKLIDFYRRKNRDPISLDQLAPIEVGPREKNDDLIYDLEQCLATLPDKYSWVLCLHFLPVTPETSQVCPDLKQPSRTNLPPPGLIEDRPIEELAEGLVRPLEELVELIAKYRGEEPPLSTAKTWKYRALQLLRQCLERRKISPKEK